MLFLPEHFISFRLAILDYIANQGYLQAFLLLFTPFTVTWSKCIPNHLRW